MGALVPRDIDRHFGAGGAASSRRFIEFTLPYRVLGDEEADSDRVFSYGASSMHLLWVHRITGATRGAIHGFITVLLKLATVRVHSVSWQWRETTFFSHVHHPFG